MKRIFCGILALALLFGLAACGLFGSTAKDWQEQYDLGMRYLDDGDYEEAILAFTAAIEIDGDRPEAYMGRAEAYIAIGEPEKALKDYRRAKKAARRSEEDYDDLLDELEEIIEELEEAVESTEDPAATEDPSGEMEETIPMEAESTAPPADDFIITVTDAVAGQFTTQYGDVCCYHIPQILLKNDLAARVNQQICDDLMEYVRIEFGHIIYSWGMKDTLLSVTVEADFKDWAWFDFFTYTISVETGEPVSQETLLAAYGLDIDSYYVLAYSVLEQKVTAYTAAQVGGAEALDHIISSTLAAENIQQTVPYIGPDGHLCMVAISYSPAGADYYYGIYDLTLGAQLDYMRCSGEHGDFGTEAGDVHTIGEITQLAAQWYTSNIGGYESGYFMANEGESYVSDGKCYVAVRFVNTEPDYTGEAQTLFAFVSVDMETGEMWDVNQNVSRGYLW